MRYIRFSNAAVALDEVPAVRHTPPKSIEPPAQTYWALNPLRRPRGAYVALRVKGDQIWVGIKAGTVMTWYKADQVLTKTEAAFWFPRAQFTR